MAPAEPPCSPGPGPKGVHPMATTEFSAPAHPSTRELRGIALYRDHADDIRHEDGSWFVPSQHDATTVYEVTLGRHEYCECSDFEFHGSRCKHVYAAIVARAKSAPCVMCGKRHKHRDLTEVCEGHLSCFEGDLLCPPCALAHGVA
jgi:SWIM zinc finger